MTEHDRGIELMTDETLDKIARISQSCIEKNPIIILGSGASVPHNIRGMDALADYLRKNIKADGQEESEAWSKIQKDMGEEADLEEALQKTTASNALVKEIVELTWKAIAEDDLKVLKKSVSKQEDFPLSYLIKNLFNTSNTKINIVTLNYDRVAEYASDTADYIHKTGFFPGIIRHREDVSWTLRKGNHLPRDVLIWKVHGSLDWFVRDETEEVVSLPLSENLPEGFSPLIVTPGIDKYKKTHDEPFRSIIQGADKAMGNAKAFLCIGYGFRDTHIQPKLVERNVPIVILAETLTDKAKQFLRDNAGRSYLAMEKNCEGGTRAYTPEMPKGKVIPDQNLWSFATFNKRLFSGLQ